MAVNISQSATGVRAFARQAYIGDLTSAAYDSVSATLLNSDPQAQQVDTITVDTATVDTTYTYTVNGVDISYLSLNPTSKIAIAAGLATAHNAEVLARTAVEALSDGVDTATLTGKTPGVAFTLTETDSLLSTASVNAAATADPIPFGRAMVYNGSHPRHGTTPLGALAKASAFTAQVADLTVTFNAAEVYTVTVSDAATGADLATVVVDAVTTDNDTAAAIEAALALALPASTVDETVATNVVTLTAEQAGYEFRVVASGTKGGIATVLTTGPSQATSLGRAFAGLSKRRGEQETSSIGGESSEYAPNEGVEVLQRGQMAVARPGVVARGESVWVELAAGSDAGKLYNADSATRVQLSRGVATWDEDGKPTTDGHAFVRLHPQP